MRPADHAVISTEADVQPCPQFGAEVDIRPHGGYCPAQNTAVKLVRSLRRRVSALKAVLFWAIVDGILKFSVADLQKQIPIVIPISLNRLIERLV